MTDLETWQQAEVRRAAERRMRNLENKFGVAFLRNSLHEARFEYERLERIARGDAA